MFPAMLYTPFGLDLSACTVPDACIYGDVGASPTVAIEGGTNVRTSIRCAGWGDLHGVRRLLRRYCLPHDGLESTHMEYFLACVVAADGAEEVVGCAGFERVRCVAVVSALAVSAPLRGQGIGARLLGALERRAARMGVVKLYAMTTTAEGYFRRHGFALVTRTPLPPTIVRSNRLVSSCASPTMYMEKGFVACVKKTLLPLTQANR